MGGRWLVSCVGVRCVSIVQRHSNHSIRCACDTVWIVGCGGLFFTDVFLALHSVSDANVSSPSAIASNQRRPSSPTLGKETHRNSSEFVRGGLLRITNVYSVGTNGTLDGEQDTEKTLQDHPWQTCLCESKHAATHLALNLPWHALSFLCSWVANTQLNHWTKYTRWILYKWRYRTPSKLENSVLESIMSPMWPQFLMRPQPEMAYLALFPFCSISFWIRVTGTECLYFHDAMDEMRTRLNHPSLHPTPAFCFKLGIQTKINRSSRV